MTNFKLADTEEKQSALRKIVSIAQSMGAEASSVRGVFSKQITVNSRMRKIDYIEKSNEVKIAVDVYKNNKKGSVSLTSTSKKNIKRSIEKALSLCKLTQADECFGLPDADMHSRASPLLEIYFPETPDIETLKESVEECEDSALCFSPKICNSEGASILSTEQEHVLANSSNFCGSYQSTYHSISCCVLAKNDSNDALERDYWYDASRDFSTLLSSSLIGEKSAQRTLARLGARKIKSQKLPVLLPSYCAKSIVGSLVSSLSGTSQYQKRSFYQDCVGKQIASDNIFIDENPRQEKLIATAPFDSEGVETKNQPLITGGIVDRYLLSSYSARRLGLKTTGNAGGARNLMVRANCSDINELLIGFPEIFVVNEFLGQGVNEVTGDFSRGVSGFIMKKGEIAYPVNEITIAGNLKEIFHNIVALGNDFDYRSSIISGSMIIEGLIISGS
jgi:PmbA protein